jgi:putative colanic acid biosynthesis UDP-glucose lipid carrier transferase
MIQEKLRYGAHVKPALLSLFILVILTPVNAIWRCGRKFADVLILIKRVVTCIIAIPVLIITIAIKLISKGPVIFKQSRYAMDGKKIKTYKFHSMTTMDNGNDIKQATKGDMTVVGPKPKAISHNEQYRKQITYYMLRHKMKPGITGWAQINGWRGETFTVEKMKMRIKYDLHYIRNWSLWFDYKIVIFTIFRGFVGNNAY